MSDASLLTGSEAAKALRISERELRKARRAGELSYIKRGRRVLYSQQDLIDFIDAHRVAEPSRSNRSISGRTLRGPSKVIPFSQRA
ncbi:MAG: helix-turn-helix domain-containing protein [Pseudomonadota bacterium]